MLLALSPRVRISTRPPKNYESSFEHLRDLREDMVLLRQWMEKPTTLKSSRRQFKCLFNLSLFPHGRKRLKVLNVELNFVDVSVQTLKKLG